MYNTLNGQVSTNTTNIATNTSAIATINAEMNSWSTVNPWITPTLLNGWVAYDTAIYATAQYYKDKFGIVHLRGMIKSGTIGTTAFTLPLGYRPIKREFAPTVSNGAFGAILISETGNVNAQVGNTAYVSLSDISFRTN